MCTCGLENCTECNPGQPCAYNTAPANQPPEYCEQPCAEGSEYCPAHQYATGESDNSDEEYADD